MLQTRPHVVLFSPISTLSLPLSISLPIFISLNYIISYRKSFSKLGNRNKDVTTRDANETPLMKAVRAEKQRAL